MKAIIMAGGKGTRVAEITTSIPKPMIEICGKPILERQINCLFNQGIYDITIITGHLGFVIKQYFGNGENFGVRIEYIDEEKPLGTAGALFYLNNKIHEPFLLINGDLIFDIDIKRFLGFHLEHGKTATLFAHPNNHPYDSGIIVTDESDTVIKWLHKEDKRKWYKNKVNAGLHILSPEIFEMFHEVKKTDLDRDVFPKLIEKRELAAYTSPEYVKDMGTPERYNQVESDIRNGIVKARNLNNKQKAVFLDRDGTINKYVGFLTDINEFDLIEGVSGFVKEANDKGYLVIVITNQPVIARGEVSFKELAEIHNKMETLLGMEGAYIDDIFICPHHPHKGYEGERAQYKVECECRKPKPGLIFRAAEKYNIDLSASIMVGDSDSDIEAGKRAGCKTIKIEESNLLRSINIL